MLEICLPFHTYVCKSYLITDIAKFNVKLTVVLTEANCGPERVARELLVAPFSANIKTYTYMTYIGQFRHLQICT